MQELKASNNVYVYAKNVEKMVQMQFKIQQELIFYAEIAQNVLPVIVIGNHRDRIGYGIMEIFHIVNTAMLKRLNAINKHFFTLCTAKSITIQYI